MALKKKHYEQQKEDALLDRSTAFQHYLSKLRFFQTHHVDDFGMEKSNDKATKAAEYLEDCFFAVLDADRKYQKMLKKLS